MDSLKYLFEKPALTRRIAKWKLLLSEFDITYVTQKVIKGQAVVDHLIAHSLPDYQPLKTFFPDEDVLLIEEEERKVGEWTLFFDGATNSKGSGVGAILYSPDDVSIPYPGGWHSKALTTWLNMKHASQINGDWKTKDEKLIPYHAYREILIEEFDEITFSYMPQVKNQFADALATLASMMEIPKAVAEWELTVELQEEPAFYLEINKAERPSNDRLWYTDIKEYLEHQKYPKGATLTDRHTIQRLAAQFVITGGILYK
ncbi:uncharacterized protein LOC131234595 [Magnolia sinica]|uniref:uncharacterized protein LOC131234595 n=1 Tax=Magnolia sinica TaxID=86752 RepID=UPI00265B168E|nr:uncharacterized protein LOC131234595 [Magnolia sinica]